MIEKGWPSEPVGVVVRIEDKVQVFTLYTLNYKIRDSSFAEKCVILLWHIKDFYFSYFLVYSLYSGYQQTVELKLFYFLLYILNCQ